MKLFFLLGSIATAAKLPEIRQHFDFASASENFRAITTKQQQGGEIDQATFDQIRGFINQISVTVKDALEEDVIRAHQVLDTSKADVDACDTQRCTDFSNYVLPDSGAADDAKDLFDVCKGEEQTEFNNMTTHCNNVNNLVNSWNGGLDHNENWNDPMHCVIPDFSNGDSDAVEAYMTCICAFVETHKDNYYDKRKKCLDATTIHGAKDIECEGLQLAMDVAHCDEEDAIQKMCHDYNTCWNRENGEHDATVTTVEGWEDVMHAQRVSLEQLICWGEHILDNNTDLGGCDDLTHAECHDYTDCPIINYPLISPKMTCNEPTANRLPCQAPYLTRVCLSPYPASGDVPCHTCTICTSPDFPFVISESGGGDNAALCSGGGDADR